MRGEENTPYPSIRGDVNTPYPSMRGEVNSPNPSKRGERGKTTIIIKSRSNYEQYK
jgi:hypothetical protein